MKIRAFTKTYGANTVLNLPELCLEKGKIYALIGANGSGKSTLARVLAGIEPCDGGEAPLTGIKVGYMPQKSFAFRMSTRKNILLAAQNRKRADGLISALGLGVLEKKNAQKLSGGETARMALARILMGEYELLVLDEPTAAMDMEYTAISERLITDFCKSSGCTVLLITHSIRQARRTADEVIYLRGGELVEKGGCSELLNKPKTEELKGFLAFYE